MNTPQEEHNGAYVSTETQAETEDTSKSQFSNRDVIESANLDKVREILFGNQMREYEKRFDRLDERLAKEGAKLRDDTKKRLDSLENYISNEVESLMDWLKNQQSGRDQAAQELAQAHKDTLKSLERKIAQIDEEAIKNNRELRQQILVQSRNLSDEIEQKYAEILAVLAREAKELRTDKTDRSTLAALFAEIAMRLKNNP